MKIVYEKKKNFGVVYVKESRLDAALAPQLKAKISDVIMAGDKQIVLDISRVEFMDSSSLGALVGILKMVGSRGDLVITGAHGIVADLFKLTRMDKVFRMSNDVEEAENLLEA